MRSIINNKEEEEKEPIEIVIDLFLDVWTFEGQNGQNLLFFSSNSFVFHREEKLSCQKKKKKENCRSLSGRGKSELFTV